MLHKLNAPNSLSLSSEFDDFMIEQTKYKRWLSDRD